MSWLTTHLASSINSVQGYLAIDQCVKKYIIMIKFTEYATKCYCRIRESLPGSQPVSNRNWNDHSSCLARNVVPLVTTSITKRTGLYFRRFKHRIAGGKKWPERSLSTGDDVVAATHQRRYLAPVANVMGWPVLVVVAEMSTVDTSRLSVSTLFSPRVAFSVVWEHASWKRKGNKRVLVIKVREFLMVSISFRALGFKRITDSKDVDCYNLLI
jgi:hypothetical protein